MKLVYVEWDDASNPEEDDWLDPADMDEWIEKGSTLAKEVGWVYKEDKEFLILVRGYMDPKDKDFESIIYHQAFKIPKGCIKTVREIDSSAYGGEP